VVGPHAYETLLATERGGLGVRILSLPDYLAPPSDARGPLDVAEEVGIEVRHRFTALELPGVLDEILTSTLFGVPVD
jgi:hypothetical protein